MKKAIGLMVLAALAIMGTGCNSLPGALKALGKDPAIVTGKITSVYGVVNFARVGGVAAGNTVSVNPDGTITVTAPTAK